MAGQRAIHLGLRRGSDAHQETPASNGGDDAAGAGGAEDQPQVAHVLFHRSSKSRLGVSRKGVGFVDDDHCEHAGRAWLSGSVHRCAAGALKRCRRTFEAMTSIGIDLLRLCNFFENVLNDQSVVTASIAVAVGHTSEVECMDERVVCILEGALRGAAQCSPWGEFYVVV